MSKNELRVWKRACGATEGKHNQKKKHKTIKDNDTQSGKTNQPHHTEKRNKAHDLGQRLCRVGTHGERKELRRRTNRRS